MISKALHPTTGERKQPSASLDMSHELVTRLCVCVCVARPHARTETRHTAGAADVKQRCVGVTRILGCIRACR